MDIQPNVNRPSDQDEINTGGSLKGLNNAGKPLKSNVEYGGAPLTAQNLPQPEMILATGPEGPIGPATVDKLSSVGYKTEKVNVAG